jgi:anaerobic magnesium-protoporphyrin IX monomethyl ester cyclase
MSAARIALLYPPPWKIPMPGAAPDTAGDGPPSDFREGDLDADFYQTPYGLFALGAQAIRNGHRVKVLNLSAFAWERVEQVIAALDADVFGMSCWTANRRGVALVARLIRRLHPKATIVIGGPHATPLAREMLEHYPEIDCATLGESDAAFAELVDRVRAGQPLDGLAGAAVRTARGVEVGPERANVKDLDTLECPHRYFGTHIVMTSRGCPWACTFCGAETTWGRGFRGHSVPYVLDMLEAALARVRVRMIQIKDDTFTTNKKRVIELCRGIRERKLNFLWSCDTRVDVLSEELLHEMRLAGCQRLSLGVESGSQRILDAIHKNITADEIVQAAEMAKRYGVHVRFYMMLGNRGETRETFEETLAFLERARPHQYIFSCLSVYPGTADFHEAERLGWLKREVYFSGDFQELKLPFDASEEDTRLMNEWFGKNHGCRDAYEPTVEDCRGVLSRLGDHHAAHLDLAGALFRTGDWAGAEKHARRAIELDHPTPGLAYNYLACIAFERGDLKGMQDHFMTGAKADPQHHVLIKNVEAARAWFKERGPERRLPLVLVARHDFQLFERTAQPTLPGPLPDDFASWDATPSPVGEPPRGQEAAELAFLPDPDAVMRLDVGGESIDFRSKHLKVLS